MDAETKSRRFPKIVLDAARYSALLVFALISVVLFYYLLLLPSNLDPQGERESACAYEALPSIQNHSGLEVSAHALYCDASSVYVYLHKTGDAEKSSSLIFRYFLKTPESLPTIRWVDDKSVQVNVGNISQVTKLETEMNGVIVTYAIEKEDYPRDLWQSHLIDIKRSAVIASVLLLLMLYLSKRTISSMRLK